MDATRRSRFTLIDASGRAANSTVRQTISGGRALSGRWSCRGDDRATVQDTREWLETVQRELWQVTHGL